MGLTKLVLYLTMCGIYALSKPTEKKDRAIHDKELSDKVHDDAESFDYDHDAFLGAEQAKTFDQLTPEESKERLGCVRICINERNAPQLCFFLMFEYVFSMTA